MARNDCVIQRVRDSKGKTGTLPQGETLPMLIFTTFVELLILIPYFGWGVYALRRRLRYGDEESVKTEVATMVGLLLFFMIQVSILRSSMRDSPILYIFSMLGLFVSAMALYAHTAISLASRLIVDLMKPTHADDPNTPRLGPAIALERQKDYEGALQEYLVLARIYPNQTQIFARIGEMHVRLDRSEEAPEWFHKAIDCATDADQSLTAVNRLAEVYQHTLKQPQDAVDVLASFAAAYPDAPERTAIEARIARLSDDRTEVRTPQLEAVADVPIMEEPTRTKAKAKSAPKPRSQASASKKNASKKSKAKETGLVALEAKPLETKAELPRISRPRGGKKNDSTKKEFRLAPLEVSPVIDEPENAQRDASATKKTGQSSGLMSLTDAPLSEEPNDKPSTPKSKARKATNRGSLESLEESPLG
jgi:tetratricopeptide (TPR) repeat protein